MTPDDLITLITRAPARSSALQIMDGIRSRAMLLAMADLLYIDPDGRSSAWLRKAIVNEARA